MERPVPEEVRQHERPDRGEQKERPDLPAYAPVLLRSLGEPDERDPKEIFLKLAVQDVSEALDLLRPVWDKGSGKDGYVSLEVDPNLAYDTEGQLLTASLMDYLLPTSAEMPPVEVHVSEDDRSTVSPLGVKGAGEDGTVGAGAAVANAVEDALAHLGVTVTAMPLTPSRVLELIQGGKPAS